MTNSEEVELKLLLQPEDLTRLLQHPRVQELTLESDPVLALESVYFDTADLDLAREGLVLRLRRCGAATVQSVKTRGTGTAGLFRRGEWETTLASESPDLSRIPDSAVRARATDAVKGKALTEVLRTEVRRFRHRIGNAEWEAYFDADVGEAKTQKGSLPICELELELVRGDPAALYDLALEINDSIALRPGLLGKAERGLAALLGEAPAPQRAERPALAPDATVEEALEASVASCLAQIVANEEPARTGVDPEGVHQLRIGIRRLRSAFSLFREALPEDPVREFRDELRWLAAELGDARDLDVFLFETLAPMLEHAPAEAGFASLPAAARELRETAYARARAALGSQRYARLLLALGAWSSGRRWRTQGLTPRPARLSAPARELGNEILGRRFRKVRRRARTPGRLSFEGAHRLRILLKRLRYASEFLRGLYPDRKASRFVRRLRRLQDILGHLNDQATAESVVERILEQVGPQAIPEPQGVAGFIAGWTSRAAREKMQPLKKKLRRFATQEPFWEAGS